MSFLKVPFNSVPAWIKILLQSELGDIGAMSIDASGLTASAGNVLFIVCYDGSTESINIALACQGPDDSQVSFETAALFRFVRSIL